MQILNVSNNHWITVSNIGCSPGTVNIYDSISSNSLPSRTKEQIAAILFHDKTHIRLQFKQVQTQHGSSDCGVFAIAFATALCSRKDPTEINFIQHQLRSHLMHCLLQRDVTDFPQAQRKRRARQEITDLIEIHCVCRQPGQGSMIQCSARYEWFHAVCVETKTSVWTNEDSVWFCNKC